MKIAVLSGKGGTGKTFISVNLAEVLENSTYIDCDVEEPNGHLFLNPVWLRTEKIMRKIPIIDNEICTDCRVCSEFCKFNALANIAGNVLVFEEVCHSCGGCALVCPQKAISEVDKPIGMIQSGKSLGINVITGTMFTKEASGVPVINQLLTKVEDYQKVVIDCPPGSACTVMESIKDADYCILVAEPTIFGAHNLSMVHELVQIYNKDYGVVLNKTINEDNPSKTYCLEHDIPIIYNIPYEPMLASLLSDGKIPAREDVTYRKMFLSLLNNVYIQMANHKFKEVAHEKHIGS